MLKQLPITISDFKDVRDGNYYYVDKSLFIKELIDNGPFKVTLIPRPRRFGKTLNMTMLKYFFEKSYDKKELSCHPENLDHKNLFTELAISTLPEYMKHQGQYPVIYFNFKDIKNTSWGSCLVDLKSAIANEYRRHNYLLESDLLDESEKEVFNQIIKKRALEEDFQSSLKNLTKYLHGFHKQRPVVLIDEYDTPIHAGFLNDYYEKIILFMRGFLSAGFKDNNNITYSVITGILRVAKESIFSGMNNLEVNTLLSDDYADKFGLTQPEVEELLSAYGLLYKQDEVRTWYNGYRAGQADKDGEFVKIYNPWSLLHFIKNKGTFGAYWANTSDNKLIQDLIQRAPWNFKKDFSLILAGETVSKKINEDTIFSSLETDANALWSFLVFSGYLTWKSRERMQIECKAELISPNTEILRCFEKLIDQWFSQLKSNYAYQEMLVALADGDVQSFKSMFSKSLLENFSYFDAGGENPECVYHGYALGMFVGLRETHAVISNREGGRGRYDICIIPHDKTKVGTIIEFKVFNLEIDKTMENAAAKALEQIEEKKYDAALHVHGVTKIIKIGIVFNKKDVLIVSAS